MKSEYLPLVFISLLFVGSATRAGIRPSFDAQASSWEATDIVVATEGKQIDGVLRVLEVWKGDLTVGDAIKIPALAAFAPESSRVVKTSFDQPDNGSRIVVSGQRMVLFLKREGPAISPTESIAGSFRTTSINWSPTGVFKEFKTSIAWIEEGKSFAFEQLDNPGPSLLTDINESEDKLKSRALEINEIQRSFLQVARINDPTERATSLEPFAHHSLREARQAALEQLAKCGQSAVPVVRRMLADDSLLDIHGSLVHILAAAGKNEAAPDLASLLEKDKEFWIKLGPTLEKGWWNGAGLDSWETVTAFRYRYSRDYQALLALTKRPYRPGEAVLTAFRDFWRSYPQLAEIDQLAEAFDDALHELDRLKSSTKLVRFEGLRTVRESELLNELREKGSGLSQGEAPITVEVIEKAKAVILEYLALRGHLHASVTGDFDQTKGSVRFVIAEGAQARIAEIAFHGNEIFHTEQLQQRMTECLTSFEEPGYNSDTFDYCLRRLNDFVRSSGYLQARLGDPKFREDKDGLVFTIDVDEGKLYRLGKFSVEGSTILTPDQVREKVRLNEGDVANGELIGQAVYTDLKEYYGNRGYVQYTAELNPIFKDNPKNESEGIVDLKLTIDEGKQFKIRSIRFLGDNLPDKLLVDLFLIRKGDVFNEQLYEESIQKLNDTGLFAPIDKDRDVDVRVDDGTQVSLTIKIMLSRDDKLPRRDGNESTTKYIRVDKRLIHERSLWS